MNTQSGTNRWPAFLLVGIVAVVVGVAAYNLGMSNGLARSAQLVAAPAVQPGIAPGAPGAPVFVYPYPYGWYRPWGFGFGFLFPLLFFGFWFLVVRTLFWRGRWHRGWHERSVPPSFDEWHRRAHEQMKTEGPVSNM